MLVPSASSDVLCSCGRFGRLAGLGLYSSCCKIVLANHCTASPSLAQRASWSHTLVSMAGASGFLFHAILMGALCCCLGEIVWLCLKRMSHNGEGACSDVGSTNLRCRPCTPWMAWNRYAPASFGVCGTPFEERSPPRKGG